MTGREKKDTSLVRAGLGHMSGNISSQKDCQALELSKGSSGVTIPGNNWKTHKCGMWHSGMGFTGRFGTAG